MDRAEDVEGFLSVGRLGENLDAGAAEKALERLPQRGVILDQYNTHKRVHRNKRPEAETGLAWTDKIAYVADDWIPNQSAPRLRGVSRSKKDPAWTRGLNQVNRFPLFVATELLRRSSFYKPTILNPLST